MAIKESVNIRVPIEAREVANELATQISLSSGDVVLTALKVYREQLFWKAVNAAYDARTPEQVASDDATTHAWSATLMDGLR